MIEEQTQDSSASYLQLVIEVAFFEGSGQSEVRRKTFVLQ